MTPETPSPLNVLAIENDPGDLNLLEEMLWSSQLKIQKIYSAGLVADANRILHEQAIDVIILELFLPDSSGIETLAHIQQFAYSIPVIILTGIDNTELALAALKEGAQDFMIKGQVTGSLLFKSIQYSLERKRHIKDLWEKNQRFYDVSKATKKAERKLRESERRYRALADQAPMFIWIAGENAEVIYSNKAMLEFFGLSSPTEITGQTWRERVHPDDEAYVNDIFEYALESRQPYTLECRMKAASGEYRWMFYKGVPRIVEQGRFGGFIGTAIDINDRKVAEEALSESEERLRLAIESTQIGTWDYFPLTGDIIWSANCKKMFGLPPDAEVDSDLFSQALHPEDRDKVELAIQQALNPESEGYFTIEYRAIGIEDKKHRWIHATGRVFHDHEGTAYRLIGTVLDITEQKLARETLEKSAEILERMVQERTFELQEANESLKKSNAELEQFAYIASHDLQEPLRKILVFSDQLQSSVFADLPSHAQTWMEKIRHSAKRMSTLIKDLLEYSRLLNKADIKQFAPIDLNHVVTHILTDLEIAIQQNNAIVHIEELPVIEALEVQMRQLFHNLLSNSLKFCAPQRAAEIRIASTHPSPGELKRFSLNEGHEYSKIIFSDNGIGFGQEFAEQIFTVFQRLHTKEKYPGTGIGLAICRRVVENHGGAIYAQGVEGEGATFIIILPVK